MTLGKIEWFIAILWVVLSMIHPYIATKKLQDEGGHAAIDSNEDVDAG